MKVVIKPSTKSGKKLMAVFTDKDKRSKTIHFGSAGMDDYTKTKVRMKTGTIPKPLGLCRGGFCGEMQPRAVKICVHLRIDLI